MNKPQVTCMACISRTSSGPYGIVDPDGTVHRAMGVDPVWTVRACDLDSPNDTFQAVNPSSIVEIEP